MGGWVGEWVGGWVGSLSMGANAASQPLPGSVATGAPPRPATTSHLTPSHNTPLPHASLSPTQHAYLLDQYRTSHILTHLTHTSHPHIPYTPTHLTPHTPHTSHLTHLTLTHLAHHTLTHLTHLTLTHLTLTHLTHLTPNTPCWPRNGPSRSSCPGPRPPPRGARPMTRRGGSWHRCRSCPGGSTRTWAGAGSGRARTERFSSCLRRSGEGQGWDG